MISLIKRNSCGKALDIARAARDMLGGKEGEREREGGREGGKEGEREGGRERIEGGREREGALQKDSVFIIIVFR